MPINTVEFDLSMVNPETGEYRTARTYTVDGVLGVDNQPRLLSIGQLVMAICLQRAASLEAGIITLMEEMIDLQTIVNRRDVAFSTSSNVVRALGTSSMDNAQNF